jgi:hypothetical protein
VAIFVAIIFLLAALLLAAKNKIGFAALASFVGAIALFIAYPESLFPDFLNMGTTETIIALLLGLVVLLGTLALKWMPNVLAVIAMVAIMWAICRLVPALPPAFEDAAPALGGAVSDIWDALVDLVRSATGS